MQSKDPPQRFSPYCEKCKQVFRQQRKESGHSERTPECSQPAHRLARFLLGDTQIRNGYCFPPSVKGGKAQVGKLLVTSKMNVTMHEYILKQHRVSCQTRGKARKVKQNWKIREVGWGIYFRNRNTVH